MRKPLSLAPDVTQTLPPAHARTPGGSAAGLDLSELGHTVQELFAAGLADSTQRAYRAGEKRYTDFCAAAGLSPFPVTEPSLSAFVAFLYRVGLTAGTIKSYLSVVRHAQIALGLGDPGIGNMPQLQYVSKGVRKLTAGRQKRRRLPITPLILKLSWEVSWMQRCCGRLSAYVSLASSEWGRQWSPQTRGYDPSVHLNFQNVRVNSVSFPRWLEVRVKASKTDPMRVGVTIYLGATGRWLCLVAALLAYMVRRGDGAGPMFRFSCGRPLTRARFVSALRSALREAGVDASQYAGHSFRISAATTAASCGLQDSLIQTLGRWRSGSLVPRLGTRLA